MSIQLNAQKMMADMAKALASDQVDGYGRKSTKTEKSTKSLADQKETVVEITGELGIPFDAERNWLAEEPGLGGDLWWGGGGISGLLGDTREKRRTRPMLTKIMNSVVAGTTKCVVVYALDRLWRSAKIAGEAIDILVHYDCLLVDRNGLVDIFSVEGRNSVLANAVAAQAQREHATVTAPRGVIRSRDKGKLVCQANCLGIRAVGNHTGQVRHFPEEHEMVRRIYRMFLVGEDGSGPIAMNAIANKLMIEGYIWTPDLHEKGPIPRVPETRTIIYPDQVMKVLQDVRYIGMQRSYGEIHACPVLLYEGEPIVPYDVFQAAQDKFKERSAGSKRVRERSPLIGRVRCGLCGLPMIRQAGAKNPDGGEKTPDRWSGRSLHGNVAVLGDAWCNHSLPCLRCDELDAYIDDVLAPLLLADVRDRTAAVGGDAASIEARVKALQRELCQRQQWLDEKLPDLLMKAQLGLPDAWDEKTLRATEKRMQAEAAAKRADLRALTASRHDPLVQYADQLASIKELPFTARRDALRAVIRWIAFFPSPSREGRIKQEGRKGKRPSPNLGTLVFLTSWGVYHTARLYRDWKTGSRRTRIRPATVEETIGGVADFPTPAAFHRGLERSFTGRAYPYPAHEVTPGYIHGATDLDGIEEIEVEDDVFESIPVEAARGGENG